MQLAEGRKEQSRSVNFKQHIMKPNLSKKYPQKNLPGYFCLVLKKLCPHTAFKGPVCLFKWHLVVRNQANSATHVFISTLANHWNHRNLSGCSQEDPTFTQVGTGFCLFVRVSFFFFLLFTNSIFCVQWMTVNIKNWAFESGKVTSESRKSHVRSRQGMFTPHAEDFSFSIKLSGLCGF